MAGWHHGLDGRESEWTPGDGDGQGGLACCDSWGRKEWTRLSGWTQLNWISLHSAWHQSQHSVVFDIINSTSITNISVVKSESESLSLCSVSMIFVSIHLQLPTLVPTLQILSFTLLLHICYFIFWHHISWIHLPNFAHVTVTYFYHTCSSI